MQSQRSAYLTVFLLLGVFLLQAWYYYPLLPQRVASHFSFSNTPDRWMDKSNYFVMLSALIVFLSGLFLGLASLLPRFIRYSNIPNKEYWLHPERRESTVAYLRSVFLSIGILTLTFFIVVMQLSYHANCQPVPRLSPLFFVYLVLYILAMMFVVVRLIRHFNQIGTE